MTLEAQVSVVMPVHNGLPYLRPAVDSILSQTHRTLELLVLDDGSTDESLEVLEGYARADGRLRVLTSSRRTGLAKSSQTVVEAARFPLIARMDADDVAHPRRLELQVAALESHPDAVLVGSLWEGIDAGGRVVRPRDRWHVRRAGVVTPFPHGTAMFRRAAFDLVGGYRSDTDGWEDLDLWLRLHRVGRVLILTEPLYQYRFHVLGSSGSDTERQWAVMRSYLADRSGDDDEAALRRAAGSAPDRAPNLPALSYQVARHIWAGQRPSLHLVRRSGGCLLQGKGLKLATLTLASSVHPVLVRRLLRSAVLARDRVAGWAGVPSAGVHGLSFTDGLHAPASHGS